MKATAVLSYRMRGSQDVQSERYDLDNPVRYRAWELMVDALRAHDHGEGLVTPGVADYYATSFELK